MTHAHRIFLDSSFWVAFRDERQVQHSRAKEILVDLFRDKSYFLTTLLVFAEIHAHFCRSRRLQARVIADLWDNPLVHLEEVRFSDQREAIALLRGHQDKQYSFCDAISFVVMNRLGLRRTVAFDDHFRQFGEFEVIS